MELVTERLVIHEATSEDANRISEQNSSDSVNEYLSSLSKEDITVIFQDRDAVSALLMRFSNSIGDGNSEIYGAWKDDTLIGFISLINGESGTPELQIEIAPPFQNQGYGFEFLDALLKYLFERKDFQYIRYTVLPSNTASISLVNHIGAALQTPKSEAERLLICTYHISRDTIAKQHTN